VTSVPGSTAGISDDEVNDEYMYRRPEKEFDTLSHCGPRDAVI